MKHNRCEKGTIQGEFKKYFEFANLKYVLDMLSALYVLELYTYKYLADTESKLFVPTYSSNIF